MSSVTPGPLIKNSLVKYPHVSDPPEMTTQHQPTLSIPYVNKSKRHKNHNWCLTYRYDVDENHTSAIFFQTECKHKYYDTRTNTMGESKNNRHWICMGSAHKKYNKMQISLLIELNKCRRDDFLLTFTQHLTISHPNFHMPSPILDLLVICMNT